VGVAPHAVQPEITFLIVLALHAVFGPSLGRHNSHCSLAFFDYLPWHIRWAVVPALLEQHEMIDHVAGPAVRIAGLPQQLLTGVVTARDATLRISWAGLTAGVVRSPMTTATMSTSAPALGPVRQPSERHRH
jgi:hypothetical protein